ncbi:hypothetical protein [Levilactobacillus parabrevis]|uniref:hypothetical protein n=1 Tax=Levilactobacillus parabrevis TaxID=357278 RepID=UPI0021A389CF|nr:hypothetical protein [Levilactobacillus parabrevis]
MALSYSPRLRHGTAGFARLQGEAKDRFPGFSRSPQQAESQSAAGDGLNHPFLNINRFCAGETTRYGDGIWYTGK